MGIDLDLDADFRTEARPASAYFSEAHGGQRAFFVLGDGTYIEGKIGLAYDDDMVMFTYQADWGEPHQTSAVPIDRLFFGLKRNFGHETGINSDVISLEARRARQQASQPAVTL
ncbi:MAG: hypothetical protein KDI11_01275 [Alphaproteobacteria bacterium]|nr:hypothetical protein [Alphaproteobacteria bacterium]